MSSGIFIGSSTEATAEVDKIAMWIQQDGARPLPWSDPGVFPPGIFTYERLLEIPMEVEGEVLIFTEDLIQVGVTGPRWNPLE